MIKTAPFISKEGQEMAWCASDLTEEEAHRVALQWDGQFVWARPRQYRAMDGQDLWEVVLMIRPRSHERGGDEVE
jgi:hypothetical protein